MTDGLALALALVVLAATLAVAVARPPYLSEAVAACVGAVLLVVVGAIGLPGAGDALRALGPTVGFLAAMLLIAEGCRREGLFDAMGAVMARGSRGSPQRLLAFVFVIAAAITAVLSLDATIVLLTPGRVRHGGADAHERQATRLCVRAPGQLGVAAAAGVQSHQPAGVPRQRAVVRAVRCVDGAADRSRRWGGVGGVHDAFSRSISNARATPVSAPARPELPRFAVAVLALTLAGFALSSVVGNRAGVVRRRGRRGDHDPGARPQDGDPGGARTGRRARVSDLRPRARGDRSGRERQRSGHGGPRRAPDGQFAARPARDRRAERPLGQPRQQPPGDADARPRDRRRRHRTGPGDADRRQRRS